MPRVERRRGATDEHGIGHQLLQACCCLKHAQEVSLASPTGGWGTPRPYQI